MSAVCEFYANRSILITGATGFLGKVLVEKFLRSVPDVKHLFLLIRSQKGQDAAKRLDGILVSKLFDRIRKECPQNLEKLVPVDGDLMEPQLGLSEEDARRLRNEVSVVIHCAATIKFDEALRVSVGMNVLGTQRLITLCQTMENLVAFVHASTAYANCDRSHIVEMVYPPPVQPQKLVEALEWMNDDMLASLTPQLIGRRPNTYTYTKALAEYMLVEESGHLPVTIVRPSIIGATWREPLPGWVDNLNGPTGLFAAVGKGILRSMCGNLNAVADIVPVDIVSNLLIVAGWHRAVASSETVPVINCCSGRLKPLKWSLILKSFEIFEQYPLENLVRVPYPRFTMNRYWRNLNIFVDHALPAYIADFFMKILGKKPRFARLWGKVEKAVDTLEYFTTREWDFQTKSMIDVWNQMKPEDQELFNYDMRQSGFRWDQYLEMYILGVKKFILNEQLSNLPQARKQYKRLQMYSTALNVTMAAVVIRVLIRRSAVFRRLWFYLLTFLAAMWRWMRTSLSIKSSSS